MIKEIIDREWAFFQETKNIGGRASCQNDYNTFTLQRQGQFQIFDDELNQSYLDDLKYYETIGRNPITEKYGYMMESTDPEYFASIKDSLPPRDAEQMQIINTICAIEVEMREAFNIAYPKLSGGARDTHTSDDTKNNTSFETYLRGELSTYSPQTLYLYGKMIARMKQNGENIVMMIQEKTVQGYGYASLDDIENKL